MNKGFSIIEKNGVKLISADCINETGLFAAYWSTGYGGVSHNMGSFTMNLSLFKNTPDGIECRKKNFARFCDAVGVTDYKMLIAQREAHTNVTNIVTAADIKEYIFDINLYTQADGQITSENLPLFVYSADCSTLLIADPSTGVYGTVHCGWKNCLNDTIQNWISAFKMAGGNTGTAIVAIGPSLCQHCFEVGEEVRELFIAENKSFEKYMYRKDVKTHIDLNGVISHLLLEEGIKGENIYTCSICNRTELNLPSYRRDKGQNGLSGGIIFKK